MRKKSKSSKNWLWGVVLLFSLSLTLIVFYSTSIDGDLRSEASTVQPVGQTGNWNLIFNDEFNGSALDTTKWVTCYSYSLSDNGCGHSNGELQYYLPRNVTVSYGTVKLRGKKETYVAPDGKTYNYTSGMISTGRNKLDTSMPAKFKYQYGYAEMRAKVPKGKGYWPAFWMLPFSDTDPNKWPPEIDAMEILGDKISTVYMSHHHKDLSGNLVTDTKSWVGSDFSTGFHVYAVDWEPNAIRWYVDGVERRVAYTDTTWIPAEPMHLLANLAIGGDWPGSPDSTTSFPRNFEIDYVRVWQKAPDATSPTPTPTSAVTPTPTPTPTPSDTTPPSVAITSPLNNATVRRWWTTNITASASDNVSVKKVEFYVGNILKCTDTTSPYSCAWSVPYTTSSYYLKAKAYDAAGNNAESTQITVFAK